METKITEALRKAREIARVESVRNGVTMREIDNKVHEIAREYKLSTGEEDWAKQEALASYIISCEVLQVIPKSGY